MTRIVIRQAPVVGGGTTYAVSTTAATARMTAAGAQLHGGVLGLSTVAASARMTAAAAGTLNSVYIESLSVSHADIGDEVTITGTNFGSTRGTSTVTFGEALVTTPSAGGDVTWAPATKEAASYISWSATEIVVTVPSMSPGAAGFPGTYHNVRVYVGGVESNAADFYMDPAVVNSASTDYVYYSLESDPFVPVPWTGSTRTANSDTTSGVQGYDYIAPDDAWWGVQVEHSDQLFMNCTFTCNNSQLNGDLCAMVTIRGGGSGFELQNITFVNCTFKENWGYNTLAYFPGVQGVKHWGTHDITFSDCHFERFSRFSYEEWGGDPENPNASPARTKMVNCTFDPCGGESISLNSGDLYHYFENNTIYGWGNHATLYGAGSAGFESNQGRYLVVKNQTWWFGTQDFLNISGTNDVPRHILFEGCHMYADSTHRHAQMIEGRYIAFGESSILSISDCEYVRFKGCEFVTGDVTCGHLWLGLTGWSGTAYMWGASNHYNQFLTSTVGGICYGVGSGVTPDTAHGYFGSVHDGNAMAGSFLHDNDISGLTVDN